MRRTFVMAALAAASLMLSLTACSGSGEPGATATVTVTATATATVTATPSPSPTPTPAAPDAIGVGQMQESGGWKVTVHSVDMNPAPDAPAPDSAGTKWVAADVETCNPDVAGAEITNSPWRLIDDRSRQFEPSSLGYNQFPQPSYGFGDTPIAPGQCIRGWIVFVVAKDAKLTTVLYQPATLDPLHWTIAQ